MRISREQMMQVYVETKSCDLNQIKNLSGKEKEIVKKIMVGFNKGHDGVEMKKIEQTDFDNLIVHLKDRKIDRKPSGFMEKVMKIVMTLFFGRITSTSVVKEIEKTKKKFDVALDKFAAEAKSVVADINKAISPKTIDTKNMNLDPKTPREAKKLYKDLSFQLHPDRAAKLGLNPTQAKEAWDRFDKGYVALCKDFCKTLGIKYEDYEGAKKEIDRLASG